MSYSTDRDRPEGQTAGSAQRPARQLSGVVFQFDLRAQVASLKREPSWRDGDRNARTLVEEPAYRVVLTALKAGTRLRVHRAPGWVSIYAIEGHLRLQLRDHEVADVPAGGLLVLQPDVPHDVQAIEESAFLLAVAAPDLTGRADARGHAPPPADRS